MSLHLTSRCKKASPGGIPVMERGVVHMLAEMSLFLFSNFSLKSVRYEWRVARTCFVFPLRHWRDHNGGLVVCSIS